VEQPIFILILPKSVHGVEKLLMPVAKKMTSQDESKSAVVGDQFRQTMERLTRLCESTDELAMACCSGR
jgi:hypothetical protein